MRSAQIGKKKTRKLRFLCGRINISAPMILTTKPLINPNYFSDPLKEDINTFLNFFFKQKFNFHMNQLASAELMDGFASLIFIILAFNNHLTSMGMAINTSLLVATIFKILNACWVLKVNSDKKENRTMLKWQCLFSPIIAGLVSCFAIGVAKMTKDGDLFQNAT